MSYSAGLPEAHTCKLVKIFGDQKQKLPSMTLLCNRWDHVQAEDVFLGALEWGQRSGSDTEAS